MIDPTLIIRIDPSHSYLRSATGYNTVTLNCIVQVYFVSGIQNLTVDWKKNSEVIIDNGDVAISDSIIYCHEHKEDCESHLKLICRDPGIFTYSCSIVWGYGTVTEDAIVNVGGKLYKYL